MKFLSHPWVETRIYHTAKNRNCAVSLVRNIESNTGKSARQGNLTRGCRRFPCLALFVGVWFYFSLLSTVFSLLFDSYVLLADDHVNNVSYFPFMSIKKVIPYFCVLREGYYVIIWLIVRICMFIKDWKLIYSELFILKRKSMENWGGERDSWHKLYSMHLPVKRTWFFCLALVQDKKISHR
jgi:hypothetical protein